MPLTRLGITPRRCSANPPDEAIPAAVRYCAVRPVSTPRPCATHSCTASASHPRKRTAEPSKGDGRLLCAHKGPCRGVGHVPAVTVSPVRPSGHCIAIPDAVGACGDGTSPCPLLCLVRPPASGTLESARGRPPNKRPLHRHPRSRSWTDTGRAMKSRQKQDSPGRLSTPRHCTACLPT
jgi:hypothetical protein